MAAETIHRQIITKINEVEVLAALDRSTEIVFNETSQNINILFVALFKLLSAVVLKNF